MGFKNLSVKETNMKYFKLLLCVSCLALLISACEGPIRKHGKPPDEVPIGKIEIVDPIARS